MPKSNVASMADARITRAKDYIAKGDDFYAKAAAEIRAAQKDDPSLSNREVARRVGKDEKWVRVLLRGSGESTPHPFRADRANAARSDARKVAREDPDVVIAEVRKDPVLTQRYVEALAPKLTPRAPVKSSLPSMQGTPLTDEEWRRQMKESKVRLAEAEAREAVELERIKSDPEVLQAEAEIAFFNSEPGRVLWYTNIIKKIHGELSGAFSPDELKVAFPDGWDKTALPKLIGPLRDLRDAVDEVIALCGDK